MNVYSLHVAVDLFFYAHCKSKLCFLCLIRTLRWNGRMKRLYKKYELTEDEIAFIESTIRVME